MMPSSDLSLEAFLLLRDTFFDNQGKPKTFTLRDKANTQDDPLDEYIARVLTEKLHDANCEKATGPLISPDLTIYRPELCNGVPASTLRRDATRIAAIEVKKLERSESGHIARATGMDYNTTPPCGTVRVYDADDSPLDIRGFYLFVTQEHVTANQYAISALALCDGDILNDDFDLYLRITSQREKEIGLGTYADGANRNRPMLIFSNPLGTPELDHAATLVTAVNVSENDQRVQLMYLIRRTTKSKDVKEFLAFRKPSDIPAKWGQHVLVNPFPQPASRVIATQARGRFRLPIHTLNQ